LATGQVTPCYDRSVRQSPLRTAAAGLIGNVLEWFDYAVYGYFSSEIGAQFTPTTWSTDDKALFTWIVFWVGFAARPIGGIVLGMVGDRIGRRALLSLSIALMGVATLVIGILPGYAAIGVAAPILLALMRVIQGSQEEQHLFQVHGLRWREEQPAKGLLHRMTAHPNRDIAERAKEALPN